LDVPENNQCRDQDRKEYKTMVGNGDQFLIPFATVFETGNHISYLRDSGQRRKFAEAMVNAVRNALGGIPPFAPQPLLMPSGPDLITWLDEFPIYVEQDRRPQKPKNEGGSLFNLTKKKAWGTVCKDKRYRHRRVLIWTHDESLKTCEYNPAKGI
jgi:hypothetical protein